MTAEFVYYYLEIACSGARCTIQLELNIVLELKFFYRRLQPHPLTNAYVSDYTVKHNNICMIILV